MTSSFLGEFLERAPFVPLTVHLADGRFFHVDHPDFVVLALPKGLLSIYFAPGHVAHVNLGAIISIETSDSDPAA